MTSKKKSSLIMTIIQLLTIFPVIVGLFDNLIMLLNNEIRLAKHNVMIICFLIILLISLLTTTWLGTCVLLIIYFNSLQFSLASSIGIIIFLNVILLVFTSLILIIKKNALILPSPAKILRDIFYRR